MQTIKDVKLMAFDPGLDGTGWALFGGKEYMRSGVLRPKGETWTDKVHWLVANLSEVMEDNYASAFVLEYPGYWAGNVKSVAAVNSGALLKLAFVCGAIYTLTKTEVLGLSVYVISPQDWKGNMPKELVMARIKAKLGKTFRDHEADAVGMCLAARGML